jgi:hypothetical protein
MKPLDRSLQKLLDAAGRAPKETPAPMSFALEARVLAGWRSLEPQEDVTLISFLRKAVALGSVIMILSIGASWSSEQSASLTAITNYAMTIELLP